MQNVFQIPMVNLKKIVYAPLTEVILINSTCTDPAQSSRLSLNTWFMSLPGLATVWVIPLCSEILTHLFLPLLWHILLSSLNYSYLCVWFSLSTISPSPFLTHHEIYLNTTVKKYSLFEWVNELVIEWNKFVRDPPLFRTSKSHLHFSSSS